MKDLTQRPRSQPYLTEAMSKVSRSFAVVVAQLEPPLSYYLATAYLICRVVDNIEDCFLDSASKQQRFIEFRQLLDEPEGAIDILTAWQALSWPGLSPDEAALMSVDDGLPLWQIFMSLPAHIRAIIDHWVDTMACGMWQLEEPGMPPLVAERKGMRLLATEEEYNQYCYFVAGTVGHLGTELVIEHYGLANGVATQLHNSAEACGRGLQKTNIVKDFVEDHARQICYLPARWMDEVDYTPLQLAGAPAAWKHKVLNDVLLELHHSLDHVLSVPQSATGYRIASLVCLLPALHTLHLAAQRQTVLFTQEHQIKIPRTTMLQCIHTAQSLWHDDAAIEAHCRGLEKSISQQFSMAVV